MSVRDLPSDTHLNAEQIQAYLDGILPAAEGRVVRAHLGRCARCRSEVEAWGSVFRELQTLPRLAPSPSFRNRVLEAVSEGAAATGAAEERASANHIPSGVLQGLLEGRLVARVSMRVDAHLDRCAHCRDELAAYRRLSLALDQLPRVEPSPDFRERVLAGWRVEELARVAMAPTSRTGQLAAWLRRRLPASRHGWAVFGGLATVPAVITILVLRAVFTSPLVTVGNLLAFFRLRVADFAGVLRLRVDGALEASGLAPWAATMVEALSSPVVAATAATALSAAILAALWVIYRFLIASQPADRPYATSR